MKKNNNLIRLLNLNYLTLTNRTVSCGGMDLPAINCNVSVLPDYIALYSQTSFYHKTEHTAVAFFQMRILTVNSVFIGLFTTMSKNA